MENIGTQYSIASHLWDCIGIFGVDTWWQRTLRFNLKTLFFKVTPETPTEIIEAIKDDEISEIPPKRIYCRHCKAHIAFQNDTVIVGQNKPINTFINPHGYIHEVLTVEYTQHTIISGFPEGADSWFPGYMWRFLHCEQCQEHLGWAYYPKNEFRVTFFGLSLGNILLDD